MSYYNLWRRFGTSIVITALALVLIGPGFRSLQADEASNPQPAAPGVLIVGSANEIGTLEPCG